MSGTIYTETLIYAAPEQFVNDAPYQLAIVTLEDGKRLTARIASEKSGERVQIGDKVELAEYRDGIPFFRKV
ncbi:MAG TPA: OB-fold domain-containing protein, partial [Bryobacteraceae bacterium]|jgi:uncharacterized OB-fold protein|nr:OB-fold domain-containing protein [Bryobacteraceae bacterium]